MPRSDRSFPVGPRLLAFLVAVATLFLTVPGAGAQSGPSAGDVERAHQDYLDAVAKLQAYQAQIAAIQTRLSEAVEQLDQAEAALAETEGQIAETRARIDDAKVRYERIRQRLSDRAAQAFMSGGNSSLEVILGAASVNDLSDRLEFIGAIAGAETDLAQQVANVRASLEFDERSLEQLKAQQVDTVKEQQQLRDQIVADLDAANALQEQAAEYAKQQFDAFQDTQKRRREYLHELAQQAAAVSTSHPGVAMPPGFQNPLKACPVDDPRTFSDGFGAPRYAGGYHLHAGNDLVSNYGIPIRAPFDGVAEKSYNALGGNSEYVRAPDGSYVYNAHLQGYSRNSTGPVKAGDVIGYIGDTGDATGTPHDHFEWHPSVVPANWPASSYGYVTIGSAVNPYPVLVDVCG